METTEQEKLVTEAALVASPKVASFQAPEVGIQEQFNEQNGDQNQDQDASSVVNAPPVDDEEQGEGAATATEGTLTGSTRGGAAAGKGKGRGGGRVASAASAKGRGGSAGKGGASARGGGKAGASSSSRGGVKGGKGGASASTSKAGKGAKSKDLSSIAGAEASGSGSMEGNTGGIGSGPSNTIFPLARVSRIVKVDKEIEMTSKDAIWTIAVATELFIKHLTDSAYAKARLDKKKTITFKELASAVESQNEFFFLQDIIPQPVPFSRALELRQGVEEKNHMREAGLFDDEEEEEEEAAPLLNQTIGDETEIGSTSKEKLVVEGVDEQGDMVMNEEPKAPAAISNGHSDTTQTPLLNGNTASRDEEMMT